MPEKPSPEARILSRTDHGISRKNIDPDALRAMYRLNDNGHKAYLVGGGVRDLMLGREPKDFDLATDASPRRVKRLFRNCRIIGRRFRLAHLHYAKGKIIEVATFRSSSDSDQIVRDGEMIRRDNVFGTPGEDALRRDLTINGLFYDAATFTVIDFVGGVNDLRSGLVRMINDPAQSFREDPVRMLRAIRHAVRIDFSFEKKTARALRLERKVILKANESRILEEFYKDLSGGCAAAHFEELLEQGFIDLLLPRLQKCFTGRGATDRTGNWVKTLVRLDRRVGEGAQARNALGLAALFSPLILPVAEKIEQLQNPSQRAHVDEFKEAIKPAMGHLRVYRRDEDRLWHALGAWSKVRKACETGGIPRSLAKRHYFPDAAELYCLLLGPDPQRDRFLEEVRKLPPPEEEPPRSGRRRRGTRRRKGSQKGQARGGEAPKRRKSPSKATPGTSDGEGKSPSPGKRRRRRRRRKKTGSGPQGNPRQR